MEPPEPHWVSQTLTPYLRYAFIHALPYGADIAPMVTNAINVCMQEPLRSADHDDLLFERVCMAIEFRYKNSEPELKFLTENLQNLARFLVRRAQLKGPYELLGRMNIGSGAWQEHEKRRLERLKKAAEKEKYDNEHPFRVPQKPEKPLPTENQIDPRLVNALPGQFIHAEMSRPLAIAEDQVYRRQNRIVKMSREQRTSQVQEAYLTMFPHALAHTSYQQTALPIQAQMPVHAQGLGIRERQAQQQTPRTQGPARHESIHNGRIAGRRQHPYLLPRQLAPKTRDLTHRTPMQSTPAAGYRQHPCAPPQQQQTHGPPHSHGLTHHVPIRTGLAITTYPTATAANTHILSNAPFAFVADTSYLRPVLWSQEALEPREHNWTLLTEQMKARQRLRLLEGESRVGEGSEQEQPLQAAGVTSQATGSRVQQQQLPRPSQVTGSNSHLQPGSQQHTTPAVMHPGFSNVTMSFPNPMQDGYGTGNTR